MTGFELCAEILRLRACEAQLEAQRSAVACSQLQELLTTWGSAHSLRCDQQRLAARLARVARSAYDRWWSATRGVALDRGAAG